VIKCDDGAADSNHQPSSINDAFINKLWVGSHTPAAAVKQQTNQRIIREQHLVFHSYHYTPHLIKNYYTFQISTHS
jgi:hypothetical protein